MSKYVTDELIERGGDALHTAACPYDGECACGGDFDREARIVLEAVAPLISAKALEAAADDLDLEDAAKTSGLNNLDFDWDGHYWEAVAEHALRACAAKLYPS